MNTDPQRELDSFGTPDGLRDALGAAREAGPGAARMAAAREALLRQAATGAATGAGASSLRLASQRAGSGLLGKLAAGALVAGLFSGAVAWRVGQPTQQPSETSAPPVDAPVSIDDAPVDIADAPVDIADAPVSIAKQAPSPAIELSPAPAAEPAAEPAPVAQEPKRPPRVARAARSGRSPRRKAAAAAQPVDPMREIELLSHARARLQTQPAETLRIAAQHERRFPKGQFVQEREVLAVHALLRQGQRQEALVRGERFLMRYPGSTHAQRVARLLEEAQR